MEKSRLSSMMHRSSGTGSNNDFKEKYTYFNIYILKRITALPSWRIARCGKALIKCHCKRAVIKNDRELFIITWGGKRFFLAPNFSAKFSLASFFLEAGR
jgi:hypothetical protein